MDTSKNQFDTSVFNDIDNAEYNKELSAWLFTADGSDGTSAISAVQYKGKFTRKDIVKFLKKKVPSVKSQWEDVQASVKVILDEVRERKQKEEEERKKAEEEMEKLEKVEISDMITKHIISRPENFARMPTPPDNVKVSAHYTGRLLDGTVFDSSVERGTPFDFTIGQGQVISCWDKGFATMVKGEKAFITCQSDAAYGDAGSPPKIPPKATLRFEVELISFEGDDASVEDADDASVEDTDEPKKDEL